MSLEAALVISGVIPIDLLALERQYIYLNKGRKGIDRAKASSRQISLMQVAGPLDRLLGEQIDQEVDRRDITLDN